MTAAPVDMAALDAPLDPALISQRRMHGRMVDHIEGWVAIEQANRLFGHAGWSYQITALQHSHGIWWARVHVQALGVDREDVGTGIPAAPRDQEPTPDAQDTAIKGAVTDALKRALRSFGAQFGNRLYDHNGDGAERLQKAADGQAWRAVISEAAKADGSTPEAMQEWLDALRGKPSPIDKMLRASVSAGKSGTMTEAAMALVAAWRKAHAGE